MDINKLETLLKKINFDDHYLEATFQFKLLMKLAEIIDEDKILPEGNIEKYGLRDYIKKRIDIVIEGKKNIAIELKMPMKGAIPAQMYKFVGDIRFLEELKSSKTFSDCFFIVVTNDKGFWQGKESKNIKEIYSFFRNNKILQGKVEKPTGDNKHPFFELTGKYKVEWKNLNNDFRYFIIKI
jgi:hypothetical protein